MTAFVSVSEFNVKTGRFETREVDLDRQHAVRQLVVDGRSKHTADAMLDSPTKILSYARKVGIGNLMQTLPKRLR